MQFKVSSTQTKHQANWILKHPKVNKKSHLSLDPEDNINTSLEIDNKVPIHHYHTDSQVKDQEIMT